MENQNRENIYKTIMLMIIAALITFIITTIVVYSHFIKTKTSILTDNSSISSILAQYRLLIDKYYLGEVDDNKLKEGAIKGYIQGLDDPYSEYISKEDMKDYLEDTMGNFVGIGIYMIKNKEVDKVQVLAPIKNSPAETAGIQSGDIIKSVDGVEYKADDMTAVATNIKGEEGTTVKLEIIRGTETLNFELKRENIKVNQVEGKVIDNNIGYIQFTSFDETTAEDFKNKYEELKNQGIKALIIDIRNNGGGLVEQALDIADYMTEKDSILLYEVDKEGKETIKKATKDPIINNIPIIILTNENTASASEILAGALKDLGKAKIVGKKTYGKGVIQQILSLKDGSGLKITIEEYQTPNKNKINKVGIEPDEKVDLPEDVKSVLNLQEDKDTQLKKAVELLK